MTRIAISILSVLIAPATASAQPEHNFKLRSVKHVSVQSTTGVATRGVVSADRQTLTYAGMSIRLIITTGPANDMMSYRIQGLRSPKLAILKGATLHILFINSDDDMIHNIKFAGEQPPFESKPALRDPVGSDDLSHRDGDRMHGEELIITAPTDKGMFSYLCTTRGHAAAGMFGEIVVR